MFKKNSTIKLLAVLGVLIATYLIIDLTKSTGKSKSLRQELVTFNEDQVDQLQIEKAGKITKLNKEGDQWIVTLDNGRKVKAKDQAVDNVLQSLQTIKPSRLVAKAEDKWKDYQVDSSGFVVKTFENGKMTLNIVIGRLGVENQRSFHTFVRLAEDKETYRVNNFMSFSIPSESSGYRNGNLLSLEKDAIQRVQINGAAQSLVLEKQAEGWLVNGQMADSTAVNDYLSGLSYLSSNVFVDDVDQYDVPNQTISFELANGDQTEIKAFVSDEAYVLNSSTNVEELVNDRSVYNKLFIPIDSLLR